MRAYVIISAIASVIFALSFLISLPTPDFIYEGYDEDVSCVDIKLPAWCMIGTDMTNMACGLYMLKLIDDNGYYCLNIVNKDRIPTAQNPVYRQWASKLASADAY